MQIHVLGDSIVTAYGSDENNFIGGWGDHLNSFQRINFHMAWDRHMTGFAPEIMF